MVIGVIEFATVAVHDPARTPIGLPRDRHRVVPPVATLALGQQSLPVHEHHTITSVRKRAIVVDRRDGPMCLRWQRAGREQLVAADPVGVGWSLPTVVAAWFCCHPMTSRTTIATTTATTHVPIVAQFCASQMCKHVADTHTVAGSRPNSL